MLAVCEPAPAMTGLNADLEAAFPGSVYLGICGDQAHQARTSSHNCGPGNQEAPITNPATGQVEAYQVGLCHALDRGHPDGLTRANMRNRILLGPRSRDVRYVLDHYTGVGYYPEWRGGGTFTAGAGGTHIHTSGTPWRANSTASWLRREMTPADRRIIEGIARRAAAGRRMLRWRKGVPHQRGRDVREVNAVLNRPAGLGYRPITARQVAELQAFFGAEPTGRVDRATWELILFAYIAHGFGF